MTEIRVLDTYWSDHCRHTTFSTELKNVTFTDGDYREPIEATYQQYLADREEIYKGRDDKFVCLMDLALLGHEEAAGQRENLRIWRSLRRSMPAALWFPWRSTERPRSGLLTSRTRPITIPRRLSPSAVRQPVLAAPSVIRLSGRTYVYQAMRVTGAADPTRPLVETLKGKLPQENS